MFKPFSASATSLLASLIIVAGLLGTSLSREANAANLYRYRNAEGVLVIEYSVPPEYIAQGYEVLSPSGRLIETIPQHQFLDESTEQLSEEELEKQRNIEEAQQREDKWLLTSYSLVDEIERAGNRKLEQIQREVDIVKSNKADTLRQLAREKTRAADYQRSGKALPKNLTSSLESLYQQTLDADNLLLQRQKEHDKMKQRITDQIQRFKKLKGL